MTEKRTVVAILRPIKSHTEPDTEQSLRFLQIPEGIGLQHMDVVGHEVDKARNLLTAQVLRTPEITHLFWVDSDAVFQPDALQRLLDDDRDIVGGLAFSRHPPYHPIIGRRQPGWIERGSPFGWCYYYPPETVFECDATGAHLLLVKREVFERMAETFGFGEWWTKTSGKPLKDAAAEVFADVAAGRKSVTEGTLEVVAASNVVRESTMSEDFSFMWKAQQCGFKIHVDTGVKTGHIGKLTITEEVANKIRPFEWEPYLPNVDEATLAAGAPVATVVIPTYNQNPRFLQAAIKSAAHQTVPVEVIVVDDGSTPPVTEVLAEFMGSRRWPKNVRVVRHDVNRGVSAALNTGIEKMTTPWFCWLSSDDMLMPRKVEVQLAVLQQSRMKASYHRYQSLADADNEWARYTQIVLWRSIPEQMHYLAQVCAINGSTVMLHRSVFDEVGLFDESLRYGQDWAMWNRIGEKYLFYPLDQLLCTRREFAGNLTAGIEGDPEKRKIRDFEDRLIRERFKQWL